MELELTQLNLLRSAPDGRRFAQWSAGDQRFYPHDVPGDGGQVSNAAVRRLHQVIARFPNYNNYPNNNRPVQPLNGRIIKHRRSGTHD